MPVTIVTTQQQQQHQLPTNGIGVKILQKDDNKSAATLMTSNTVSLVSAQTQSKPNRDHEDAQTAFLMLQENSNKFPRNKKQSTSSTATTIASIESLEPSSSSNSSAATSTAVVITIDRSANLVNSKKSTTTTATQPPRSSFASTESNDEGTTTLNGRANSHQSHYSTDKSGSSGYYSSNVCSTYSVEDHIYCEPVIGVLDLNGNKKQKRKNLQTEIATTRRLQQQQPIQQLQQQVPTISAAAMNVNGKALLAESHFNSQTLTMNGGNDRNGSDDTEADEDESDGKVLAIRRKLQRRIMPQNFSEKLRILETSIDNLDRHLKNFPSLSSQEHIVSYVQCHQPYMQQQQHESFEKIRLPYNHHLPTIMEGYDPVNQPRPWQDSIADDSLLDIDLDSFLLTNETKEVKRKVNATTAVGIDNPTFITDEVEENNYKCVKYINSCPENAYRVESDIVGSEGHGTASSQKSLTAEHYMRRYEDQLHFQNTRELLEDVRDKIRVLSQSNSDLRSSSNSSELSSHSSKNSNEEKNPTVSRELSNSDDFIEIPKELESMIKTLKHELEIYLDRMNQRSDYEIRQLCSGLVKNEHIVKIKKAFARRHSITQKDYYEAINSDNALVSFKIGVPSNIRQQLASIRCASDPNFKMKRKSLTEVFPTVSCFIETANEQRRTQTQLQRNLSYHKPILNHLSPEVIIKDMNDGKSAGNTESNARKVGGDSGVNALRGTGSGSNSTKSGESGGDKDSILDWHRKKPSIWEQYYGTNRMHQSLLGKRNGTVVNHTQSTMSYPSSRPESDFTLDLPRAEQLRIKMEKEKKFRQRCRFITTFLSLVFFLLTVMVVSLVLTRGKRMFGSMI